MSYYEAVGVHVLQQEIYLKKEKIPSEYNAIRSLETAYTNLSVKFTEFSLKM